MTVKNQKFPAGYYQNTFQTAGELERSGSSGRIDMENTASEDSCAPIRKCMNVISNEQETLGAPFQVISLSNMLPSDRRNLKSQFRSELEQIQILQKRVEMQRMNGVAVSSSSDIISRRNGKVGPRIDIDTKSSVVTSSVAKKMHSKAEEGCDINRDSTGWFESAKPASAPSTTYIMLMKQCDTLLKRLMSHQYGYVFNVPVDPLKLNIPDYHTIIKHPMDFGTIKNKIVLGQYSTPLEFLSDVRLTFSNAITYNPPTNDVHVMAVTLSKFFEIRWKHIAKKIPASEEVAVKLCPPEEKKAAKPIPPSKKRKISSIHHEVIPEPVKKMMMSQDEKHKIAKKLESLLGELPVHIIDFLRKHSSNGKESEEEEIEIDIDALNGDTLFILRQLLDDYLKEKHKNQSRAEPCEIELRNESGLSNSSMQHCKGDDLDLVDEDVDIGGNEPPVSSYPPVMIEKDTFHRSSKCLSSSSSSGDSDSSSDSESENAKYLSEVDQPKVAEAPSCGRDLDESTNGGGDLNRDGSVSMLEQQKPSSVESDCREDGDSAPNERQISPNKLYRAAILNRFADTILKAKEKTLGQGDKVDPEKLQREREELELQRRKEKARLQAEAKAAEEAQRQAEAEAVAEAKQKLELRRVAQREALSQLTQTVQINESSMVLEDLGLLGGVPSESFLSCVGETSPEEHSHDILGALNLGGGISLEQLGLFMKKDEDEEDGEAPMAPKPLNDVEEGEID